MNPMLSFIRAAAVALLCTFAAAPGFAQDKVTKLFVGYPPGAGADTLTRLLADRMRTTLAQPVIVENKAGASGRLAVEQVKIAAPDGTTLLMTPLANVVAHPHSYANLRYNPFTDLEPVAHLANFQLAFVVGADVPAKNLKEYVALVKKDPKYGNYASAGAGSLPHFFGVMFGRAAGIEMTHVPYKGTAPALADLAGGQIAAFSGVIADVAQLDKAGKVRVLATSGAKRAAAMPDVPTFREQGYDIEGTAWYALFAPAKTPRATVDRLAAVAIEAIKSPEVSAKLQAMGLEPTGLGPAELATILKTDYDRWGPVIKASGFKAED
jgi:tripartite-type tricarboxylate transporter receptor subunit TctC